MPAPSASNPLIEVKSLRKEYLRDGNSHLAIKDVSIEVQSGERLAIVGPSGAGKTTLLRCISGLQPLTSGTALFKGEPIVKPPADLAIVFQDYRSSLFPWMTVSANVLFPLKYRNLTRAERTRLVEESLTSVGLAGYETRYPHELSGGMQQRVAIARALACKPEMLLMDEPFASVDAQTRLALEDLTLDLCARYRMTLILITHDIDEAVYMSDRVLILSTSPAIVIENMPVELPKVRDQLTTKSLAHFAEARRRVYEKIHVGEPRP
jgi:NitT/TauT family transport system ATP-binding protein